MPSLMFVRPMVSEEQKRTYLKIELCFIYEMHLQMNDNSVFVEIQTLELSLQNSDR